MATAPEPAFYNTSEQEYIYFQPFEDSLGLPFPINTHLVAKLILSASKFQTVHPHTSPNEIMQKSVTIAFKIKPQFWLFFELFFNILVLWKYLLSNWNNVSQHCEFAIMDHN